MTTETVNLSDLRDDGDTLDLPDGRTLRLTVEVTDIPAMETINDCDAYGRVAWPVRYRYPEMHDGATDHRPDDFDGAARKLHPNGWHMTDPVWWQPHPTAVAAGPEAIAEHAEIVTQLLSDGFYSVRLEVLDGTDAYGRPIVTGVASLGGLDTANPDGYLATVIADLAAELEI